jgi:hypothetical protein
MPSKDFEDIKSLYIPQKSVNINIVCIPYGSGIYAHDSE